MAKHRERDTLGRRPRQNYLEMGFHIGDVVTFEGTSEVAKVASGRTIEWRGHEVSLKELRRKLGRELGTAAFRGRVTIDNHDLDAAYDATYGAKAKARTRDG